MEKPRVLIVDDEVEPRTKFVKYMVTMGFEAVGAASASEALQKMRDGFDPAIVFTDFNMGPVGVMTGLDLADKIWLMFDGRQDEKPRIVLVTSAEGLDEIAEGRVDEIMIKRDGSPWPRDFQHVMIELGILTGYVPIR